MRRSQVGVLVLDQPLLPPPTGPNVCFMARLATHDSGQERILVTGSSGCGRPTVEGVMSAASLPEAPLAAELPSAIVALLLRGFPWRYAFARLNARSGTRFE